MELWNFAKVIFGGVAAVSLFVLIHKLYNDKKEKKDLPKADPSKPSNKDLKESLQIAEILNEIYKV
jgi:hypothetical protein